MADLKRLKGSERVRKRVSVMMGSDDIRGCQHTLFEIVSNSIDRHRKGFGDYIKVIKHKDLSYTIIDHADGLPMDWNEKEHAYNWDLALKVLYAGDNYDANSTALGINGLGLCSSQYASEFMEVISYKEDKKYTVKCKKGRPIDKETGEFICEDDDTLFTREQGQRVLLVESNSENKTGTYIHYKPDLEVFTNIDISIDWINDKLDKQAMVNKGLKIEIYDEKEDKLYTHFYESGIKDYIKTISNDNNFSDVIYFTDKGKGRDKADKPEYDYNYEIALVFNNEINRLEYYHNSSELLQGGSTSDAISLAFTYAINEYAKDNNVFNKNESKIKFTDIQDSLICVISSFSTMTSYANQTKLSIDNKFIKDFTNQSLKERLKLYFIENKLEADRIVNQILINKRANDKAEKSKIEIRNKLQQSNKKGLSLKIEGLKDCDMRNSQLEERILLVDEGVSPNSTIIKSFDGRIMGAMGLRGRFINALKSSVTDVLKNVPAHTLITALGCGIEIPYEERKIFKDIQTFNLDNLRYGSVGILCDADAFGKGINLALITFFYKFIPTLLKQGRVFLVKSPRFCITTKKDTFYAYDENEKNTIIQDLQSKGIKYDIGIKKGLGEFNTDEFWTYVLSPEAREKTFIQLDYNTVEEDIIKYYFDALMGEDIAERKKYIREHITNVDLNELD
ncbi:DNA topoisomerase [Clostridium haemolyticum]|uniref:DNA topoisomerase (ATP-hydrolyzing) n=1 Tax=Clostridium haemolyticum NCTC 9693 TaxID=1443114 RepID=A0ABR4TB11_CLOHA|nr:DNA topoisomerase [Clostridium haemolyticum]KEI14116.1 putative DNA gyrase B subunit [Clostridium haemolyticum NCTC 9693]